MSDKIRSRFAPSPTGYMHIGNLRTALYEYLLAKNAGGTFILRLEDTDQSRLVEGADQIIYDTLKEVGIIYDEGPDVGGDYGPYIQSKRKDNYLTYAKELIEKKAAYYCFCSKTYEQTTEGEITKYPRTCLNLTKEQIEKNLSNNKPYVIRQLIPSGTTTFTDEVFGTITVENTELDDMVLIKSDGLPTYNFANVIDDHLMKITHIMRGSEYLSSTPKYNLLYQAFGFDIPIYLHLAPIAGEDGKKLSKRRGDASYNDLVSQGFLPQAIINYIALLGFSPSGNQEFFTLEELVKVFDIKGLSKSPAIFDRAKLTWMNSEYFKKMPPDDFYIKALPILEKNIKRTVDFKKIATLVQSRINFLHDIENLVDFIDTLNDYDTAIYIHKKMKTTKELSKNVLEELLPLIESIETFKETFIKEQLDTFATKRELKNGQVLWPIRTALTGKETSFCGASELLEILGKEESILRIKKAIELL